MNMPPTLKLGSTGPDVERLQRDLSGRGYTVAVDGNFGENTENAVKKFQQDNGITADGVVGPQTGQKLGGPPA
ncbi:peptidoglycan-binding domain-containing protein [Iningainema tapete]|uniref:Peptidoglycan-binding protein n=1 Tax=Iningainema tapete BLCC-T55 TaxID=2748662 RepID=A0A8J6XPN3_9CYAN|nr:peptidoglycan-binding domain-containing protein [Iningainema tapete]MBD2775819.1 peptidoglycan-binding protein [Iningainema tapete BLCC-T55]